MLKKGILILLALFVLLSFGALWFSYRYPPTSAKKDTGTQGTISRAAMRLFSAEEVAQHATSGDC
ncbi:TPA: hypothetical protein DEB00_01835 [Candidatus Uhrbacteria bacterium]|nr:hypothetical protein [Candidatus Uhrbacteria bacterium]